MAEKLRVRLSPRSVLLILLGLATGVKTLWAVNSLGTWDSMTFFCWGKMLEHGSLAALYECDTFFNQTPLAGWLFHQLCIATHNDPLRFAAILRFACILADVAVVLGLLRLRKLTGKPPLWGIFLFAISPVSIMVSGYHGNLDPIMVMFLFFAAVGVVEDQPILSGVMFALACNIKVVPLIVSPVFIFYWIGRGRREAVHFMVAAGALMLTGAAWALIHCPVGFLRNVLGYASVWGGWGISYWLRQTGMRDFNPVLYADPSLAQSWITFALKIITLAGICFLGWRRRKLSQIEFFTTLGAAFSWIFVFMPGAGVQYMVWWAPFILLLSPRWWIALTAGATVYLARFYYSTADFHFPWVYTTVRTSVDFYWGPSTNLVWGTFIALLLCRSASWFLVEKRAPGASPVSRKPSSGQLRPGARAMRRRCFCGKAES